MQCVEQKVKSEQNSSMNHCNRHVCTVSVNYDADCFQGNRQQMPGKTYFLQALHREQFAPAPC